MKPCHLCANHTPAAPIPCTEGYLTCPDRCGKFLYDRDRADRLNRSVEQAYARRQRSHWAGICTFGMAVGVAILSAYLAVPFAGACAAVALFGAGVWVQR